MSETRRRGIITLEQARDRFIEYYNKRNPTEIGRKRAKLYDSTYQKKKRFTLRPGEEGSERYLLEEGPRTFDMVGVDSFPEGEEFEIDEIRGVSKGTSIKKPSDKTEDVYGQRDKTGQTYIDIAAQSYEQRFPKEEDNDLIKTYWRNYRLARGSSEDQTRLIKNMFIIEKMDEARRSDKVDEVTQEVIEELWDNLTEEEVDELYNKMEQKYTRRNSSKDSIKGDDIEKDDDKLEFKYNDRNFVILLDTLDLYEYKHDADKQIILDEDGIMRLDDIGNMNDLGNMTIEELKPRIEFLTNGKVIIQDGNVIVNSIIKKQICFNVILNKDDTTDLDIEPDDILRFTYDGDKLYNITKKRDINYDEYKEDMYALLGTETYLPDDSNIDDGIFDIIECPEELSGGSIIVGYNRSYTFSKLPLLVEHTDTASDHIVF